jgi:hypothetical protein
MADDGKVKEGTMDIVASHQRVLLGSILRTSGPILELGVGWYSTPLLHEIATTLRRPVLTVDNNKDWFTQFEGLENAYHQFKLVGWWGELWPWLPRYLNEVDPLLGKVREGVSNNDFAVALIDQNQPCEREYSIRQLLGKVQVFVMHDTEEGPAYGYNRMLPAFAHQWTDKCQRAWTTVASNVYDVSGWFDELPPVEETTEVT